jgi:hypothetical protein
MIDKENSSSRSVDAVIAGDRIFTDNPYLNAKSEELFDAISLLHLNPTLAGPGNPFVHARKRVLLSTSSAAAAAAGGRGECARGARRGEGRGGSGAAPSGNRGGAVDGSKREESIWGDEEEEHLDIADTAAGIHPAAAVADYLYFDDLVDEQGERLWPGESADRLYLMGEWWGGGMKGGERVGRVGEGWGRYEEKSGEGGERV